MNSENDLMQKLMISKKIMDKHNNMERGQSRNINMGDHSFSSPMVEDYQSPAAKYNIPQEFMGEQEVQVRPKSYGVPSEDRIVNSKLPDEIKNQNPILEYRQKVIATDNNLRRVITEFVRFNLLPDHDLKLPVKNQKVNLFC